MSKKTTSGKKSSSKKSSTVPKPVTQSNTDHPNNHIDSKKDDSVFKPFSVGVHRVVITPPVGKPTSLAGYGSKADFATGVADDLYASSVVIDTGDNLLAYVACDLMGLVFDQVDDIRTIFIEHVSRKTKGTRVIPKENIMVSCTHTHNGPDTVGIFFAGAQFTNKPDTDFLKILPRYIAGSLIGAYNHMVPNCKVNWAFKQIPGFSANRRHDLPPPQPDYRDVDPTFGVVQIKNEADQIIAFMLNFACHPTTIDSDDNDISSDFIGKVRQYLNDKYGKDIVILYLNGPCGDIAPRSGRLPKDPWKLKASKKGNQIIVENFNELGKNYLIDPTNAPLYWVKTIELGTRNKFFSGCDGIQVSATNDSLIFNNVPSTIDAKWFVRVFTIHYIMWSLYHNGNSLYAQRMADNFSSIIETLNGAKPVMPASNRIALSAAGEVCDIEGDDPDMTSEFDFFKNSRFFYNVDKGVGFHALVSVSKLSVSGSQLIFLNFPGEAINEISIRLKYLIREQTDVKNIMSVEISGGQIAYILTPEEFDLAGYESLLCLGRMNGYNIERTLFDLVGKLENKKLNWRREFDYVPNKDKTLKDLQIELIEK